MRSSCREALREAATKQNPLAQAETPWAGVPRLLEANLAPLQGRLTASPTPAKPIYDQAAHYGTDHGADDENLDLHRTSPPNNKLRQRTYCGHLIPTRSLRAHY